MEKIAIISDVHGNLEALKSVLEDINKRKISKIFCLGDIIAKGAHSRECIRIIKKSCEIILLGNVEDYFTKNHDLDLINDETEKERITYYKNYLSSDETKYLSNLPFSYEFYMSGSLIRLFHATPDNLYDKIGMFAGIRDKYNLFLPSNKTISQSLADVVVYGHLHVQIMEKLYNKTLINCGSVGNSIDCLRNSDRDGNVLETVNAQYLIIEGEMDCKDYNQPLSFQFIKVPYNIEKELSTDLPNLDKENYSIELREGKYRDMNSFYKSLEKEGIDISQI